MTFKTSLLALGACTLLAGLSQAQTVAVPIINPSFESPGGTGTNTFLQVQISGTATNGNWTSTSSNGGISSFVSTAGVANTDGTRMFEAFSVPGSGYAGQSTVYQQLSTSFVAGTTYALTLFAGNNVNGTMAGVTFSLDNSALTQIASVAISSSATPGGLVAYTLTYVATGLEGGTGNIVVAINTPPNQVRTTASGWITSA